MAITKLSDVASAASSKMFTKFLNKAYHDNANFIKSGIATPDPAIAARCAEAGFGGSTVNLPFWGDLQGDADVIADVSSGSDTSLSISKLSAGQDAAAILRRAKAFGVTDLAVDFAGDDPMAWIASRLGAYWARQDQKAVLSVLKGVFTASTGAGANLIYDISGETGTAAVLGKDTLLWAAQKLGDQAGNLTAVSMCSQAATLLASIDAQASLYRPSQSEGQLATYNGRAIVVDDNIPYDASTGVATIYLFGRGAVALNECPSKMPFEVGRNALTNGGQDFLVTRRASIAHVRGMKWVGTPSGATPTNSELETAANWSKVYDDKDIRVVKLVCKLA